MKRILPILLLLSVFVAPLRAAEDKSVEVNYVDLASVLAGDGEYARAEAALAHVDPATQADDDSVDWIKYHTVRGIVALNQEQLPLAVDAFDAAIAAGQADPLIHLYRAQAFYGLERFEDVLSALSAAGDSVKALSSTWIMRAQAQWMLKHHQDALDTLTEAGRRFPENSQFERRQVFYLIELGLNAEAAEVGQHYLSRSEGKVEDYVAIGTALRRTRAYDAALGFLEKARLMFPGNGMVARALAQAWAEKGNPLAAAEILAQQAELEPVLFPEAAELMRRAGNLSRALTLNARIADSGKKMKQRVGLLLAMRRYEEVASLESALSRARLLDDESLRYALAYAFYQSGKFDDAERNLTALKQPELFRKATELRRLMQDCANSRWTCS
ncbi:MAG: hypothetical protein KDI75_00925 [Xanthomonadales bacterium]|nr:hypothetical protein [Xanthomonadales bacterium]